jgi:hypothetical protein
MSCSPTAMARLVLAEDAAGGGWSSSGACAALRAHPPVRLVAAQHDTSVAMIEKRYSAYVVDAIDELAAKVLAPLIT